MSRFETNKFVRRTNVLYTVAFLMSVLLHTGGFVALSWLPTLILSADRSADPSKSALASPAHPESIDVEYVRQPTVAAQPVHIKPADMITANRITATVDSLENNLATAAEAAAFAASGDQNVSNDIRTRYILRLRAMIEQSQSYPIRARQLGLSGRVIVSFTIQENGKISDVKVTKPCHHNLLNESAIELVENIDVFEPIPHELGLNQWPMHLPIDFAANSR